MAASGDHPRACGAHLDTYIIPEKEWGSSPRMRGSLYCSRFWSVIFGIIPAHAGLTSMPSTSSGSTRDHPRACGAHTFFFAASIFFVGSSPRMRGSRNRIATTTIIYGIIPAHAGLTTNLIAQECREVGSSPRMRGSLVVAADGWIRSGIIPAHAGLTTRPDAQRMA